MGKQNESRRDFIKKAAYIAPAILTMSVAPTVHAVGSGYSRSRCNNGVGNGQDCRPGRARFNNDDAGGVPVPGTPGDPGSRGGSRGGNAY